MDNFIIYSDSLEEALENLKTGLIGFEVANISLSHQKYYMLLTKGVVIGHIISSACIEAEHKKNRSYFKTSKSQNPNRGVDAKYVNFHQ